MTDSVHCPEPTFYLRMVPSDQEIFKEAPSRGFEFEGAVGKGLIATISDQ